MDLGTPAKLGEIVGGVFVVVSLIYPAHQAPDRRLAIERRLSLRCKARPARLRARVLTEIFQNNLGDSMRWQLSHVRAQSLKEAACESTN